jgi:hypothetical protein
MHLFHAAHEPRRGTGIFVIAVTAPAPDDRHDCGINRRAIVADNAAVEDRSGKSDDIV